MKNKGFTLIEITVGLALLLIITSLAIFGYNSFIDNARRKVCEGNLKALTNAIEYYSVEFDALPATLGNLRQDHFDRAFARMMEEHPIKNRFYGAVAKWDISGESHAAFLTYDNLKPMATEDHFKDPDDSNGGTSYGINSNLTGKKWSEIDADDIIVADSDSYAFSGLTDIVSRHRRGALTEHLAMAFTKGKELLVFSESITNPTGESAEIYGITILFDNALASTPGTVAADLSDDVRNNLYRALSALSRDTPDNGAAKGRLTAAQVKIQNMINNGYIDSDTGSAIINQLQTIKSQL